MKISPELQEAVLARAAKGQTLQAIAAWLQKRHAITVSHQALSKIVRKHRAERAQISKHIVREHIERTLPEDLSELDRLMAANVELLDAAQKAARKHLTTANVEMVVKLTSAVQKADEAKKKALGVDQPDSVELQGLADLVGLAL